MSLNHINVTSSPVDQTQLLAALNNARHKMPVLAGRSLEERKPMFYRAMDLLWRATSRALPATDAKTLPELLDSLGEAPRWREARVGVLLWMGRDHEAMEAMQAAIAGADRLPAEAKGERQGVMREVARVFKAHDLNIKRANAYLSWAYNPVGDGPLKAFLAEAPAKEGAVVVSAEAKTP